MEIVREYQKGIMAIDESKGELKKGATAKCKKIIDETYSKISEEKVELETELYKSGGEFQRNQGKNPKLFCD